MTEMEIRTCVVCRERFNPTGMKTGPWERVTCSDECSLYHCANFLSNRFTGGGFRPDDEMDPVEFANLEHRAKSEKVMEIF